MPILFSKTLIACGLALACATALAAAPAAPADGAEPAKAKPAKAHKAKAQPKRTPAPEAAPAADETEPDITDTTVTEYSCELGNKITTYHNDKDDSHIALRWKKRLHRLTRIGTTTGARRFENALFGLVWIGIPAKGMLLDSKLNRQLANECKSPEQIKPVVEAAPVPQA
ncbi:MAG: hypothetical protein Q8R69_07025 [Telluria sp.]|nr:hypothetical protein [Telluria sp.]